MIIIIMTMMISDSHVGSAACSGNVMTGGTASDDCHSLSR